MNKKPAFWHICHLCKGKGETRFHGHDLTCFSCKGCGGKLELVTVEKMREWCDKQ